ncbi:hypothetical protein [Tenacibaculum finnmarkense]|uniref:Uncharacterized protein n=3 Tax=Tenacibaculum finnmarkense TaxID=2781243 RepID=A0A2I2M7D7_9FLAO|nr:hypothetical protein [Tenacibaculum finnmarkense]MBE7660360.1 hypothetical protein [Tenacibaculum finnmarkense genomovar finnmarkense]MBE7695663.1 hypothetical protein [Tenacibaculum finnmarkense genomovar finnmarkense]MBE7698171.1 hypothetical protein [Tenacibaculum finnmarkense genomovar ulcerans]MCD8427676.1 hypothetical protein [Tenacibaculum finnmarkense genomovar finnmarkense]MCG8236695.1 hypothetical protein [Tenacibaculum finnmarkense genomovar ulcerans]
MNENKIKHLEFIQNIITRMNRNSFQIKGMSITISSALLALSANNSNILYASIIYFSLFIFWGLDSYYLSQEKGYRDLYNRTRIKEELDIDFNLKLNKEDTLDKNSWQYTLLNKTIYPLYLLQAILSLILILTFKSLKS